jgi:hypothetical protein
MPAAPFDSGLSDLWTLLLALVISLALGGCHDTSQLEVCAEIDCVPGECAWGEGTGQFCNCPSGFHDEGPHCIADGPDGDLDADADHDTADADEPTDADGPTDADEDLDADQETSPPATLEDAFDLGRGQDPIDMGFGADRVVVAFIPDQAWTALPDGERDIIQFRLVDFATGAPAVVASGTFDASGSTETFNPVGHLLVASSCGSSTATPWALVVISAGTGAASSSMWLAISSDGSDVLTVENIGPSVLAGMSPISQTARIVDSGTGCSAVWPVETASGYQVVVRRTDDPDGTGSDLATPLEETTESSWYFEVAAGERETPVVPVVASDLAGGVVIAAPARRRADGAAIVVGERLDAEGIPLWGGEGAGEGITLFDAATLGAPTSIQSIAEPEPNSVVVAGLGVGFMITAMTGATSTSDRCVYWTQVSLENGHGLDPNEVIPCGPTTRDVQLALISGVPTPRAAATYWEWSGTTEPPLEGHVFLPEDMSAGALTISSALLPAIASGRGAAVVRWMTGGLSEGVDLHIQTVDEMLAPLDGWLADGFLLSSITSGASVGPDIGSTPLPSMLTDGSVLQVWSQQDLADGSRVVKLRRVLPPR